MKKLFKNSVLMFCIATMLALPNIGITGMNDRDSDINLSNKNYIEIPQISAPSGNPTADKGWLYVKDSSGSTKLYFENDSGSVTDLTNAATTAWDDIADPDAAGTIAMTSYQQILTSTKTDGDNFIFRGLGAFGDISVMRIESLTGNPTDGTVLEVVSHDANVDPLVVSSSAQAGVLTVSQDGTIDIVGAVDMTGNLGITGDITVSGSTSFGTVYQTAIAAAASGNSNLTIDAAGTGTITIGGTSTGATTISSAAVLTGNVDIGNAATDTLTITSIIDGNVTLNDNSGNSPSLILQDATDETATFIKVDGDNLQLTTTATEGLEIVTGNLVVGNGSPGTAAMDGEDFYVNGDSEFDGAIQADGLVTAAAGATISGATTSVNASSNFATNLNTGSSTGALTLGGGSGTVAVASTTWDVSTAGAFSGVTGITAAAGEAMTMTLASNGAADDLTISVTGANDASVVLASAGTGSDAIKLSATAGGVEITGAKAAADQVKLSATGTVAGNAINLATTDGGIVLTAGGAANGDMTLTVGDDLSITSTGTTAIDSSDWDISATGAATNIASIGFDSASVIYFDTVELTNADIKALRATPKALVTAPGANKFIEFVSAVLILDYGSEVLTESTDNLVIQYNTSGQDCSAAIETTGFIDQAANQLAFIPAATIATMTAANAVNKALELFNTGDGEIAGNASNDTTMTVKVAYRIHADGL